MGLREFLRGGYQEVKETTIVANHGRPVFTVIPAEQANVPFGQVVGYVGEAGPEEVEVKEDKE